ncbi:MAG TPA: cardiolipin synthase [Candidatus Saccharimonadia bacterium]|nr:cardiolipin synthase [Candidatus Saccharimonadia bacterium]
MKKRKVVLIAITVVVTALLVILALNFVPKEKQLERHISHSYNLDSPQFTREMGTLLGPAILPGNLIRELENGDEIFPAMLEAIRGAKKSITFETYIYWSGDVGKQFADAIAERARAGVRCHVLLDWVGSAKMKQDLIDALEDAGVEVERYHPLHWYHLARMNNRTHRKVLVVDGRVGFTGGVGIADEWSGHAQDPEHWRDAHFRVEGPVVAQMQAVFTDNWMKTSGAVLTGEDYFPPLQPAGESPAQMFSSSPSGGSESMQLMYLMSIAAAERTIDLSASYFLVDKHTSRALVEAAKRGVKVRIIVPGRNIDAKSVRHASRGQWGPLLQAGIEISEYEPTMFHCKIFVVDGLLVSVGSTNFDNRSFELNDEANLNIYDRAFGARMIEVFEQDLKKSKRITYEAWRKRPFIQRVREKVLWPFHSQM